MKPVIVLLVSFFSVFASAGLCIKSPDGVLADSRFETVYPLIRAQEYVGNQGTTLAARKDHDTYFNWDAVNSRGFYGRLYNAQYEKALLGHFSVCKTAKGFALKMGDFLLPLKIRSQRITVKYKEINFTFAAYPLRRHGTLRAKLKASTLWPQVRVPKPWNP